MTYDYVLICYMAMNVSISFHSLNNDLLAQTWMTQTAYWTKYCLWTASRASVKDFKDFLKQPNPLHSYRAKFVNVRSGGKTANFAETVKTRIWLEQDESLLRLSFWSNHVVGMKEGQLQSFLQSTNEIESQLASPECQAALDKLFALRYLAVTSKYRYVSYLTLTDLHILLVLDLFLQPALKGHKDGFKD